jgi:hypothetical protein
MIRRASVPCVGRLPCVAGKRPSPPTSKQIASRKHWRLRKPLAVSFIHGIFAFSDLERAFVAPRTTELRMPSR